MRLTAHTDFGLRMLLALAVADDRLVTIEEIAARHRVSKNHLMKVAQSLVALGLVRSVRGRGGGLALAAAPDAIRIGRVVRALETDTGLVACLGDDPASCAFTGVCRLTGALGRALEAFFGELDRWTLADLAGNRGDLRRQLDLPA